MSIPVRSFLGSARPVPALWSRGARLSKDADYLQGLLASAEVVGGAVGARGARHYLFGPVEGEAIVPAMKTACNWMDDLESRRSDAGN